jgi:hypothetical protein
MTIMKTTAQLLARDAFSLCIVSTISSHVGAPVELEFEAFLLSHT